MARVSERTIAAREAFEAGFKWGLLVRERGTVTRTSSDEEFRKALSEAWIHYWGTGPKKKAKSAAAGGK
jgi:hypothetical protein